MISESIPAAAIVNDGRLSLIVTAKDLSATPGTVGDFLARHLAGSLILYQQDSSGLPALIVDLEAEKDIRLSNKIDLLVARSSGLEYLGRDLTVKWMAARRPRRIRS